MLAADAHHVAPSQLRCNRPLWHGWTQARLPLVPTTTCTRRVLLFFTVRTGHGTRMVKADGSSVGYATRCATLAPTVIAAITAATAAAAAALSRIEASKVVALSRPRVLRKARPTQNCARANTTAQTTAQR